jgi:hypothetical protein
MHLVRPRHGINFDFTPADSDFIKRLTKRLTSSGMVNHAEDNVMSSLSAPLPLFVLV